MGASPVGFQVSPSHSETTSGSDFIFIINSAISSVLKKSIFEKLYVGSAQIVGVYRGEEWLAVRDSNSGVSKSRVRWTRLSCSAGGSDELLG